MNSKDIELKIRKLPDTLIPQVLEYIDLLISKQTPKKNGKKKFKFDWEGSLSHLKKNFTSIDLQHKVSEWR